MSKIPPPLAKFSDHSTIRKPSLPVGDPPPSHPTPASSLIQKPKREALIFAGWIILGVGYIIAAIAVLISGMLLPGFLVGFLFCGVSGSMGIIVAAKGKARSGVFLIVASVASVVLCVLVPVLLLAITGNQLK